MQGINRLARHFLQAEAVGDQVELPLSLDLAQIQLENQYQSPDEDPEPIENDLPTINFDSNNVGENTTVEHTGHLEMMPPLARFSPQFEDTSELLLHQHSHDENMSKLEMAIAIWASNTSMSRTEFASLRQILSMIKDISQIHKLPNSLDTLKRHLTKELPLLPLRKKAIPLVADKLATEKALRKSTQNEQGIPTEDLYFFDPIYLYKAFMSSDIANTMHTGFAEYHDSPTELYHSRAWASSVRTTSGQYSHYSDGRPIFPSDFVTYKCFTVDCEVCTSDQKAGHIGRVYSVGRDCTEEAAEHGAVVLEIRMVRNANDIQGGDIHPLESIISTSDVFYLPEYYILSGPLNIKLDYAYGEHTKQLRDYGQLETPLPGEHFVRRVVDSFENMNFTPLCRTDPIRAELELRQYSRDLFVNEWNLQNNGGKACISVPLVTFIDGFGLYRNSYRSLMGFYQIPAAMNFRERNRRTNVLPITLGPHGSNFDDVVDTMKEFQLLDKGVLVEINGEPTNMCVFTMCYCGDMPQQQENSGFKSQRATLGCRFCFIDETTRGDLKFDVSHQGRYHNQTISIRKGIDKLRFKGDKETVTRRWGMTLKAPSLVNISPALDIITSRPGDPAHSEYNGMSRMSHEILLTGILTPPSGKAYSRALRQFPFPKGWARLQSPLHHLKSYSLSEHARWAAIIPCLLRTWLTVEKMQPSFVKAVQQHTPYVVTFVVQVYAAIAKSNSLLCADHFISAYDREHLKEIVLDARRKYQQLCTDAAGGHRINPRRGATPGRSRSATPAHTIASGSESASASTLSYPTARLQGIAPVQPTETFVPVSVPGVEEKKTVQQFLNDVKKPNVHTGLHYDRTTLEYALPSNVSTLIGEDKHR